MAVLATLGLGVFHTMMTDATGIMIRILSYSSYLFYLTGAGIVYVYLKKIRKKYRESANPIDKAPDLSQYYDTSRKAVMDRKDDLMGIYHLSDDETKDLLRQRLFKWLDEHF